MWTYFKNKISSVSQHLFSQFKSLFQGDVCHWDRLEDLLLQADLGYEGVQRLLESLKKGPALRTEEDLQKRIESYFAELFGAFQSPLMPCPSPGHPYIVLFLGVNGAGKTTSIGKLGFLWKQQGYRVRFVAADTFRAGAQDQLHVWAQRAGVPCTLSEGRKDPSSVVYQGIEEAILQDDQIVLIDTAGRLPNKKDLMDELEKMHRIISKKIPTPDHYQRLLVLDATTGQHSLTQVDVFSKVLPLSGVFMNKLDGTAKGGTLANIVEKFRIPIRGVGTGEKITDLQNFSLEMFLAALHTKETP